MEVKRYGFTYKYSQNFHYSSKKSGALLEYTYLFKEHQKGSLEKSSKIICTYLGYLCKFDNGKILKCYYNAHFACSNEQPLHKGDASMQG